MFNFFKRSVTCIVELATPTRRKPISAKARALMARRMPVPEVIEGNSQLDWDLWHDSVAAWNNSQAQPQTPDSSGKKEKQPASRMSISAMVRALIAGRVAVSKVVEGNSQADWDLWQDSVNTWERQLQSLSPGGNSKKAKQPVRRELSARVKPVVAERMPVLEVVEGSAQSDWSLWHDSVNAWNSPMQPLAPSSIDEKGKQGGPRFTQAS